MNHIPEPGNERDRLIAETWMGWLVIGENEPLRFHKGRGGFIHKGKPEKFNSPGVVSAGGWKPSTDIAAAYEVEEAINSQGHRKVYTQCLAVVLLDAIPNNEEELWWAFAHANPEQRSRAAIIAWEKVRSQQSHDA